MAKQKSEQKKPEEKEQEEEEIQETEKKTETEEKPDRLADLEKKVGEMGEYIGQSKEFINGASVVIQTLAGNPELTKAFQAELRQKQGVVGAGQAPVQQSQQEQGTQGANAQPSDETKAIDQRVTGVETSQRENIIRDFEVGYGIDKLKAEERSEARKKIATYLADFGWKIDTMPLPVLRKNLEKAYVGTHAGKLREEGKLEGMTKVRELQNATIGTMSGGAPETTPQEGLTPEQKKWAKALNVDEEEAAKLVKSQDEEKTRVSDAEKKAKEG